MHSTSLIQGSVDQGQSGINLEYEFQKDPHLLILNSDTFPAILRVLLTLSDGRITSLDLHHKSSTTHHSISESNVVDLTLFRLPCLSLSYPECFNIPMSCAHLCLFLDIPSPPRPRRDTPLTEWMDRFRSGFEFLSVFDLIPALFPHRKHDIDYFASLGDDPASIRDAFSAVVHSFLSNYYLEPDFKIITTDEPFPDAKPLIVAVLASHTKPCSIDPPPSADYWEFGWITIPRPGKVVATFRTPFSSDLMKASSGSVKRIKRSRQQPHDVRLAIFVIKTFSDSFLKSHPIVNRLEPSPPDYRLKVPTFEKVLRFRYHPDRFPVPAFPLFESTMEEDLMVIDVGEAGPLSQVLGWREPIGSGRLEDVRGVQPELEQFWIPFRMMENVLTDGSGDWILDDRARVEGWRLCDVVDHRINAIWGASGCPRIEKWRSFVVLRAAVPGPIQKDVSYIEILILRRFTTEDRVSGRECVEYRASGVPWLREIVTVDDEEIRKRIDEIWGGLGFETWICGVEQKEKDGTVKWFWVKRRDGKLGLGFNIRPAVGIPLISIAFAPKPIPKTK